MFHLDKELRLIDYNQIELILLVLYDELQTLLQIQMQVQHPHLWMKIKQIDNPQ